MSQRDPDPVHVLKAFLQTVPPVALRSPTLTVGAELRVIQDRLDRARRIDERVSLSEAVEALLGGPPIPLV